MKSIHTLALVLIALSFCLATGCAERSANTPMELSTFAGWKGAAVKDDDSFTFIIVSDRTGSHAPGRWIYAVERVNGLAPDFVMSVGDAIEGYTEDANELEAQWDEFDGITSKLDAPFFYVPGNHDVSNDVMLKTFIARHGVDGKSYYSFDYKGRHFVILDTNTAKRHEDHAAEQVAWLEKDIAAAASAKHVFVFYHHPKWKDPNVWASLARILPAGKTTVFAGHLHKLGFKLADGIPVYTLASTSSIIRGEYSMDLGQFNMVAQVTAVDDGAKVAFLSVDQVFKPGHALRAEQLRRLTADDGKLFVPEEGGQMVLNKTNPLEMPIKVSLRFAGTGWQATPAGADLTIEPGQTIARTFTLSPRTKPVVPCQVELQYEYDGGEIVGPVRFNRSFRTGISRRGVIHSVDKISVDGQLDDWANLDGFTAASSNFVHNNPGEWLGPDDNSFSVKFAIADGVLYTAIDVTDDEISTGARNCWNDDSIEFYWENRPVDKRELRRGKDSGQVIITVPEPGQAPKSNWYLNDNPVPKGFSVACKRRDGGYVFELSVPLAEIGTDSLPTAANPLLLDVQINDCDIVDGLPTVTSMNINGAVDSYHNVGGYMRCSVK